MKRKFIQVVFFLFSIFLFSESKTFTNARNLAQKGFWEESLAEIKKIPKSEKNSDVLLLEAFAKVMTNQSTQKDENYILENASLENKLIMLLKKEQYDEVIIEAATVPKIQLSKSEQYLLGLAYLGKGEYSQAEVYLGTDSVYALFYTALCQYIQGKNQESLANFQKVSQKYPAHKLGIESHIYSAKCYIVNENYDNAIKEAKFAINKAINFNQKAEAALLVASLYQDLDLPQEGIAILKPLITTYNQEAIPLKFKLAELYIFTNQNNEANLVLADIQRSYAGTSFAEEASFKRGQIYFEQQDYYNAKNMFSYCVNNFPHGSFIQQSLYYDAYSTEMLGKIDESVLSYQKITTLYPDSSYSFYAYERLAFLFYEKEEYERALASIEIIQEDFPQESTFSSVNNLKPQIQLILSGAGKNEALLLQQWNNKRANSLEGMKAGLELSELYLSSVDNATKGVDILVEILGKIGENTTSYEKAKIGAEANTLLALYNCINADYVFGSEYYLKAASLFMGINTESAAEAMYKAALALSNARKTHDVNLVYNKMKTLYPTSSWTAKTYLLTEGQGGSND